MYLHYMIHCRVKNRIHLMANQLVDAERCISGIINKFKKMHTLYVTSNRVCAF